MPDLEYVQAEGMTRPTVAKMTGELQDELSKLEETVHQLSERIEAVLQPELVDKIPTLNGSNTVAGPPVSVHLNTLQGIVERVARLRHRVVGIADRVDL